MQSYSSHQSNLAEDASQLMMRIAHIILFVGVPVGAAFSRRAVFILLPLGLALILLAAAMNMPQGGLGRIREVFSHPAALFLSGLLIWSGLSLIWTPYIGPASERLVKTTGTFALALWAAGAQPTRTKTTYLYLILIGLGLGSVATAISFVIGDQTALISRDIDGSILDRSALGLNLILWPALAAAFVRQKKTIGALLLLCSASIMIIIGNKSGLFALGLALLTAVLCLKFSEGIAKLWAGLFTLILGLAPVLMLVSHASEGSGIEQSPGLIASLMSMADMFHLEGWRLLTGHGFDSLLRSINTGILPSHAPRSVILEIWYELGFWGMITLLAMLLVLLRHSLGQSREIAPFQIGALAYLATLAILGEASFQLWWISLIALVSFAFSLVAKGRYRSERPAMRITGQRPQIR